MEKLCAGTAAGVGHPADFPRSANPVKQLPLGYGNREQIIIDLAQIRVECHPTSSRALFYQGRTAFPKRKG
jgi:hypothetical protein